MIHPERITEQQSELGDRRAPLASWHLPAFPNLSLLQPNESHRRFVAWQVPAGTNRDKRTETWTRLCIDQHSRVWTKPLRASWHRAGNGSHVRMVGKLFVLRSVAHSACEVARA
jgi:hypothetical protein